MPLDLTAKANLIPLQQKHGLYTQKRLGQHFLVDQSVITASLAAANVQSADTIVEVGAGTGVLTIALARTARQVISYEIDPLLQPLLSETLSGFSNIDLRIGDFLHDPNAMPAEPYKFIANLRY